MAVDFDNARNAESGVEGYPRSAVMTGSWAMELMLPKIAATTHPQSRVREA
jgi:hypothetical protein